MSTEAEENNKGKELAEGTSIEMGGLPTPLVDVGDLSNLHQQWLSNNNTINQKKTLEIVDVLGGIDNILQHYIKITKKESNDDPYKLNDEQIQQINSVLSSKLCSNNETTEQTTTHRERSLTYFKEEDTFLYSVFNREKADLMTKTLWNRYIISGITIITLIWYFPAVLFGAIDESIGFYTFSIIWLSIYLIYNIFLILSVNRTEFWPIIKSFDFWFKMYAAIKIIIASILYYPLVSNELYAVTTYQFFIYIRVCWTFVIVLFSFIDGFPISWQKIVMMGILISLLFTVDSFRWTLDGRPNAIIKIFSLTISLKSSIASSDRILSIFLWKQTLLSALKRRKSAVVVN